jgi:hypothetical protein
VPPLFSLSSCALGELASIVQSGSSFRQGEANDKHAASRRESYNAKINELERADNERYWTAKPSTADRPPDAPENVSVEREDNNGPR